MLWSLLSSAYIIYLYRKMKAEREPHAAETGMAPPTSVSAELDTLNQRLDSLEARLGSRTQETPR